MSRRAHASARRTFLRLSKLAASRRLQLRTALCLSLTLHSLLLLPAAARGRFVTVCHGPNAESTRPPSASAHPCANHAARSPSATPFAPGGSDDTLQTKAPLPGRGSADLRTRGSGSPDRRHSEAPAAARAAAAGTGASSFPSSPTSASYPTLAGPTRMAPIRILLQTAAGPPPPPTDTLPSPPLAPPTGSPGNGAAGASANGTGSGPPHVAPPPTGHSNQGGGGGAPSDMGTRYNMLLWGIFLIPVAVAALVILCCIRACVLARIQRRERRLARRAAAAATTLPSDALSVPPLSPPPPSALSLFFPGLESRSGGSAALPPSAVLPPAAGNGDGDGGGRRRWRRRLRRQRAEIDAAAAAAADDAGPSTSGGGRRSRHGRDRNRNDHNGNGRGRTPRRANSADLVAALGRLLAGMEAEHRPWGMYGPGVGGEGAWGGGIPGGRAPGTWGWAGQGPVAGGRAPAAAGGPAAAAGGGGAWPSPYSAPPRLASWEAVMALLLSSAAAQAAEEEQQRQRQRQRQQQQQAEGGSGAGAAAAGPPAPAPAAVRRPQAPGDQQLPRHMPGIVPHLLHDLPSFVLPPRPPPPSPQPAKPAPAAPTQQPHTTSREEHGESDDDVEAHKGQLDQERQQEQQAHHLTKVVLRAGGEVGTRPGESPDDSRTDQTQGQGRGQGPEPQGQGRQRHYTSTGRAHRGHTGEASSSTEEVASSEGEHEGEVYDVGGGEGHEGEEGEDVGLLAWQLADATGCCSVCLGDLEAGEELRLLPGCGHVFHKECVDRWLLSSATCPNCRTVVLPAWMVEVMVGQAQRREREARQRGEREREARERTAEGGQGEEGEGAGRGRGEGDQ